MEVCRLCLDLLQEKTFMKLGDPYKCIVNSVIPEVDLEISCNPVICNQCSNSIDKLHKFKILCFETQQKLKQKCKGKEDSSLTVKEILHGSRMNEILITDKSKERICRTCLESVDCESFTILKPSNPDAYLNSMLTMCLPEVDLQISRDPVMCEKCLNCLQKFHHLKTICLDVEEKLKNYKRNQGSKSLVNLNRVLESLQDNKKDKPELSIANVKTEKMDIVNVKIEKMDDDVDTNNKEIKNTNICIESSTLIKQEEEMDIKLEE